MPGELANILYMFSNHIKNRSYIQLRLMWFAPLILEHFIRAIMKALFVCKPLRWFCFLKPKYTYYIFVCYCRFYADVYCKCCTVSMLLMKKFISKITFLHKTAQFCIALYAYTITMKEHCCCTHLCNCWWEPQCCSSPSQWQVEWFGEKRDWPKTLRVA